MKMVRMMGERRVEVIDAADPVPAEGQALVRIEVSLVCGSEMHTWRGDKAHDANAGHEPAGVVVDASRSTRWKDGDRVGIHAVWGCGTCEWCRRGCYTWCDSFRGCAPAHSQLMAVPEHVLAPLPDDVDFEVGALLAGDGLGVPFHTSQRLPSRGGDTVVVVGCGPIGLGNILLHSFRGANVIAFDLVPERLAMAMDCGASHPLKADEVDPVEAVRELTRGQMAEAAIDATGRPEGLALALKVVGRGGIVACNGENREVTIHVGRDLIRRDITLFGSWFFHFREYWDMLELYRRGLALEKLVTDRYPLARAGEAFADFECGRVGKPALLPQR